MLDADGLHDAIVPDQFIKTDMVADKAITENKIDKTNIVEWTDEDGNKVFDRWVSKVDGENITLKTYDEKILSRFNYDVKITPWLNEGIHQSALD